MTGWYWPLFTVNAIFAVLVTVALPHGQDMVYALMAGSQLGMLFVLGRARLPRMDDQRKEWDHSTRGRG